MPGEAQRVVNIIGQIVEKNTANGAKIHYTPATIDDGSAYNVSAYMWVEELLEDIGLPAGAYVQSGDYVVVGISGEGRSWIERVLPTSLYARMVMDYNRGRVGIRDPDTGTIDWGLPGQVFVSGGEESSSYWVTGGGGGGVTDHGALTGLGDNDHPQYLTEAEADALYDPLGSGVSDHGGLTGLGDDDHPQYATNTEFDDHSARHENGGADEISIAGLDGTPTELTNHLNDTSDAHDAESISIVDAGGHFAGSDVESALQDLASGAIVSVTPPSLRVYMWQSFR